MAVLFMGAEMGSFVPSDGLVKEATTSTIYGPGYESGFARCAVRCGSNGSNDSTYADTATFASTSDIWVHFALEMVGHSVVPYAVLSLVRADDTAGVRIRNAVVNSQTGTLQLQYRDALDAWQNAGEALVVPTALGHYDFHVDLSAGSITLYIAGTERRTVTGLSLSHLTGFVKTRHHATYNATNWSQVIVSDEPTVGGRLFTVPVTGAGASSGFNGSYAEIDEAVYSDTDYINSASAGQVSTFSLTAPALTGYVVKAVGVYARAKKGGSGPTQLQLVLRVGGTDYLSSTKALGFGYGAIGNIWETNPASLGAWTNTPVATLQAGVKSIA